MRLIQCFTSGYRHCLIEYCDFFLSQTKISLSKPTLMSYIFFLIDACYNFKFNSAREEVFTFIKSSMVEYRIIILAIFQATTNMSTSNHVLLTKVLQSLPAEHTLFPPSLT